MLLASMLFVSPNAFLGVSADHGCTVKAFFDKGIGQPSQSKARFQAGYLRVAQHLRVLLWLGRLAESVLANFDEMLLFIATTVVYLFLNILLLLLLLSFLNFFLSIFVFGGHCY